jgi:hypothetical protein
MHAGVSMATVTGKDQIAIQVDRIISSKEFSSSRQLREFLRFVSQRALDGSTHLDQYEIASAVLHKSDDFNPLDDASVRRLATLTRQRLSHYYSETGREDRIVVSLPLRSYLPEFRQRDVQLEMSATPATAPKKLLTDWRTRPAIVIGIGILLATFAAGIWLRLRDAGPPAGAFLFTTMRGDIYGPNLDLPGAAVRLGPQLGPYDEVSVRMLFTPEVESHQAGLLLWKDPDNYIKVGRRFTARSILEFAVENDSIYKPAARLLHYDPEGQTGEAVWLSLRRRGNRVAAFASRDGLLWKAVGDEIESPFNAEEMRIGLYAFNGRRAAPAVEAKFDHLGVGPTFSHGRVESGVWTNKCPDNASHSYRTPVLQTGFLAAQASCLQALMFPVPKGDWSYRAQIDFPATPGVSAGLMLRGSGGSLRVVRHFTSEPTIALIHEARDLSAVPDFSGSPRLILRFAAKAGVISASFSRDDRTYQTLSRRVDIRELGSNLEIGICHGTGPWGVPESVPSAEFYYLRREINQISIFR